MIHKSSDQNTLGSFLLIHLEANSLPKNNLTNKGPTGISAAKEGHSQVKERLLQKLIISWATTRLSAITAMVTETLRKIREKRPSDQRERERPKTGRSFNVPTRV